VGDVEQCIVRGLDDLQYLDNRDGNRTKVQSGDLVLSGQTDDAFVAARGPVEIVDPVLRRTLKTEKQNSSSTIIWNPWNDGAASLADLGNDEWRNLLCAEGGNILSSAVTLQAGETHLLTVNLSTQGRIDL
jgi:glucose-6-phosphate 1-epimerase